MNAHRATGALGAILIAGSIAACSAAPAASTAPSVAPSEAAATVAPATPSPEAETAAPVESNPPVDTPAPSRSHKPLPSYDPAELDAYLTSSITLVDLADGAVSVDVTYIDSSSGDAIDFGSYDLNAIEQMTDQVPPGTYKLVFHLPDATKVPACTIDVGDKDAFTFAAVPGGVAVAKHGAKPGSTDQLSVATSSLCGH
jgi:hypothetical protein